MISRKHRTDTVISIAHFSDDERHRYFLSRTWDPAKEKICFLMLNPSTATEEVNDPTIERCQRRAMAMGYGGFCVVNLFTIRLTDSTQLKANHAVLHEDLDTANQVLAGAVDACAMTICGWGKHRDVTTPRVAEVLELLVSQELHHKLYALKSNNDGSPQHPLYIAYSHQPEPWPYVGAEEEEEL